MIVKDLQLSNNFQGGYQLTLTLTNKQDIKVLQELQQLELMDLTLKKHSKKRSLSANSYAWVLITEIANVLRANKDDIYIKMLRRYGQREKNVVSVVSDAVDIIYKATQNHCYEVGQSETNGKMFTHLAILRGSSEYNSKDMSIFIDGIVTEARDLGIETMTISEVERLKNGS